MQDRKETQMYRTDFWTLWEKARVGWSEKTASKHVYYQVWNRSLVQVGCMRQVLRAGALGWPRGMGWEGRWEGGFRMGNIGKSMADSCQLWEKPLQYCKVISLQLIKIIGGKKGTGKFWIHLSPLPMSLYLCNFKWLYSHLLCQSVNITYFTSIELLTS